MNPKKIRPLLGLALALAAFSTASAQTLLREDFNQPTGIVYAYPGPAGSGYRSHLNGKLDAWSGGGVLEVAYLKGVGAQGTGGIRVVVNKPTDRFHLVTFNGLPLGVTGVTGDALTPAYLRSLQLEFAAQVPKGKSLALVFLLEGGDATDAVRWEHRLVLPLLNGGGADSFQTYVFKGSEFDPESIARFVELARTRGEKPVKVKLQWLLNNAAAWKAGEGITLDELELRRAHR